MKAVVVGWVLLVLAAGGCDRPAPGAEPATTAAPFALDLPPCGKSPSPDPGPPPEGAVIPPGTRITAVREQAPLVQLNGYVTSTPRDVRAWVETQSGLEVIASEDEGYEAELLVTDGTWRTFIKVRAVCSDGSMLAEVIAPADSDAVLSTPAGRPTP